PRPTTVVEGARDVQAVPAAAGAGVLQPRSGHAGSPIGQERQSRGPIAVRDELGVTSVGASQWGARLRSAANQSGGNSRWFTHGGPTANSLMNRRRAKCRSALRATLRLDVARRRLNAFKAQEEGDETQQAHQSRLARYIDIAP